MDKKRVLYVAQEIDPYTGETTMGGVANLLPQKIQESGKDIRIFLPRFGTINERRHQLHEVIRLSGMNLIIDDFDHQLIIKVASIQKLRLQVYFIDNEEYFPSKQMLHDLEGNFMPNNEKITFGQMSKLKKIKMDHRFIAFQKLKNKIKTL